MFISQIAARGANNEIGKNNGLPVTSASNTLSNVVEGVTLTLSQVTTRPVQVTVGVDSESMKKALTDFAKAYSDINKYITDQTK